MVVLKSSVLQVDNKMMVLILTSILLWVYSKTMYALGCIRFKKPTDLQVWVLYEQIRTHKSNR